MEFPENSEGAAQLLPPEAKEAEGNTKSSSDIDSLVTIKSDALEPQEHSVDNFKSLNTEPSEKVEQDNETEVMEKGHPDEQGNETEVLEKGHPDKQGNETEVLEKGHPDEREINSTENPNISSDTSKHSSTMAYFQSGLSDTKLHTVEKLVTEFENSVVMPSIGKQGHKIKSSGGDHAKSGTAQKGIVKLKNEAVPVNRAEIDTAAPFESVKEAVSMFGGIVDWKQQKILNMEKRQYVEAELHRLQMQLPSLKKELASAEEEKVRVLQELNFMKKQVDDTTLKLERAQTVEQQATQDSDLARLKVEEMEKGATDEVNDAWKAQLQVAIARQVATATEFQSVKAALENLQVEYQNLVKSRDIAIKEAECALQASEETERKVDELTLELIATRDHLDMAHIAHQEAEEQRISVILSKEKELEERFKEIKSRKDDLERLQGKHSMYNDLQSQLNSAYSLLESLTVELASYRDAESKLSEESIEAKESVAKAIEELEHARNAASKAKETLYPVEKELEETNEKLEDATNDLCQLTGSVESLREGLQREKTALATLKQREGMASVAIAALEAELKKTNDELESAQYSEEQAKEVMAELPKSLKEAANKAEEAKAFAQAAREDMQRSREELEQVKAATSTAESKLQAAIKETEAAKASEAIAVNAIKALTESELAEYSDLVRPTGVKLSLEEYYALCKKAHDAEELANNRLEAALKEVDQAKQNQNMILKKLEETNSKIINQREAVQNALTRASMAKAGKLAAEDELRKWRAEHEQRRKAGDTVPAARPIIETHTPITNKDNSKDLDNDEIPVNQSVSIDEVQKDQFTADDNGIRVSEDTYLRRKKKSLLPRIIAMLLARKKNLGSKTSDAARE